MTFYGLALGCGRQRHHRHQAARQHQPDHLLHARGHLPRPAPGVQDHASWCISLQRHDQERCSTATRPASSSAPPRAASPSGTCRSPRRRPTPSPRATATRSARPAARPTPTVCAAPNSAGAGARQAVAWLFAHNVQKPTGGELEEAHDHADHEARLPVRASTTRRRPPVRRPPLRDADQVPRRDHPSTTAERARRSTPTGPLLSRAYFRRPRRVGHIQPAPESGSRPRRRVGANLAGAPAVSLRKSANSCCNLRLSTSHGRMPHDVVPREEPDDALIPRYTCPWAPL